MQSTYTLCAKLDVLTTETEDRRLMDVASCSVQNCGDMSEDSATSFVSVHVEYSLLF